MLEVFFGFAREAHDDVAGDADIAVGGLHPRNSFEVLLTSVEALHGVEHAGGSALDWEMHVIAERRHCVDGFNDVFSEIAGVRSGETHAANSGDFADGSQQFCE